MSDIFEIQQTINCSHQAASIGDWDQTVSTFASHGVLEMGSPGKRREGYPAMREAFVILTAVPSGNFIGFRSLICRIPFPTMS
jgi:hypothetical protein